MWESRVEPTWWAAGSEGPGQPEWCLYHRQQEDVQGKCSEDPSREHGHHLCMLHWAALAQENLQREIIPVLSKMRSVGLTLSPRSCLPNAQVHDLYVGSQLSRGEGMREGPQDPSSVSRCEGHSLWGCWLHTDPLSSYRVHFSCVCTACHQAHSSLPSFCGFEALYSQQCSPGWSRPGTQRQQQAAEQKELRLDAVEWRALWDPRGLRGGVGGA